jgi:FSR family fosmidomycin resistance protein-like MFS transporter
MESSLNIETLQDNREFQTGRVAIVSTAHAVHDTYTGFFPALLPILIQKFSMTNTAAGMLSVFMRIPSLLQPFIGHLADRKNLRLLIILAPAVTGAAMSSLGIATSYGFLAFLLILAGTSSSFLHAIGPVLGSTFSGVKLGRGMSFWMVGGELGRALGPLITVSVLGFFTLEQFPWLMMAGVLTSVLLYSKLHMVTTLPAVKHLAVPFKENLKLMKGVMLPVTLLHLSLASIIASLTIFLPTYLTIRGSNLWMAGASLTILEISGMIGAFLAGTLSDRFGRRRILGISFTLTPILMVLLTVTQKLWQIPILILLGFSAISVTPVIMAIVMENFPENRSFANGVYMALSFIIGALATLLVGFLSDLFDMQLTFLISAGLALLGLPIIFWLPKSKTNLTAE